MTDTQTTETTSSKAPSHIAYHVREGKDGGKAFWSRVGSAWQHRDGKGFSIQLFANPVDGYIQLRVASDEKK